MSTFLLRLPAASVLLLVACELAAAPIVELNTTETRYQGRNIAHNKEICWLATTDGALQKVLLQQVTSYRKTGDQFVAKSPAAVATGIRGELNRGMDVQIKGNFVVVAPRSKAKAYTEIVSQVNQSFAGYFSRRSWKLDQVEFPLVIVVHPSRREFDQECRAIDMTPSPHLKGFYHPQTNRVTMYDPDTGEPPAKSSGTAGLSEEARQTLIHETIHQLAFNSGLHSRIGENPRWVVEGLAVTMEGGALNSAVRNGSSDRINQNRLDWFHQYRATRRSGTIADLITNDEALYQSNPLDFYSEAWALTFYLSESRRPEYIQYLKRLSTRDPLREGSSPQERLADFQAVFGKDLRWMETQFLRFIDGLETP